MVDNSPKTPKKRRRRKKKKTASQPSSTTPRRRSKNTAGRIKRVKKKVSPPWRRYLVFSAVGFFFIFFGIFLYADRLVRASISNLYDPGLSGLYGSNNEITHLAIERIAPEKRQAWLISNLSDRRYTQTDNLANPGEYKLSDDSIEIITRPYRDVSGQLKESLKVKIPFSADNEILDKIPTFSLEPSLVAPLGSGEYKASNFVPLADMPEYVKNSVLAIEDERFYSHFGIDPVGIVRAMFTNVSSGELRQGASTLTQQLAKNSILTPERTFKRKVLEIFSAISLEIHLTKDQILERYLNDVYLGQDGSVAIHGFPAASQVFFGKPINKITLSEAALLAGIIQAPSYRAPQKHLTRAIERRDTVIDKMRELKFCEPADCDAARKFQITLAKSPPVVKTASHYVAAVTATLQDQYGIEPGASQGLKIYTGLNLDFQRCAEKSISEGLVDLEKKFPRLKQANRPIEAGLVSIEPHSGLIRAWVGGRDFSENQYNHVNQAERQIGSTIKPFLYLSALDPELNNYKTASPISILRDEPIALEQNGQAEWEPENYDHEFRGDVTLRYALERSLNMPAIYVAQRIGFATLKKTVELFRMVSQIQALPSLALGALDTSLLRLTAAYAALANTGIYVTPRLFTSVVASNGEVLAQSGVNEERIAAEAPVYVLTNILQGVIERGTASVIRKMGFTREAAGKTGTSNSMRDAWFVGFVPDLTTGIWIGFDDNSVIGLTGGNAAAPIWASYMKCISQDLPNSSFIRPKSVILKKIDAATGQLAKPDCPVENVIEEVFVKGTEPKEACSAH